jgi:MoxR-like ATPase
MTGNEPGKMTIEGVADRSGRVIAEVEKAVVGKRELLELMMAAFLSPGGHILLEDYPGLAKTLVANCFAEAFGMSFKRIQFTPDLLPGDITGGYVFDGERNKFALRKGPIFTNVLLADEINRASPKTQSALLEAMQEGQVTMEGETMRLPEPFIVVATQNPIEYEGTFPLPEAQLDRFMVRLSIGYPKPEEEVEILRRRMESKREKTSIDAVLDPASFLAMREAVEEVHVDPDLARYIVELGVASRGYPKVVVGSSPRGSLALLKLARSWAAMRGRSYALPDDIKLFAQSALAHRIVLDSSLWDVRRSENGIIDGILKSVPVPLLSGDDK